MKGTSTEGTSTKRAPGAEFLRASVRAVREWPGWFTAVVGALLCVLGWYGVSGETLTARQLPYLASATVPGAALIVAGAVLVAARSPGRGGARELTDRRVEVLYTLLVEQLARDGDAPDTQDAPDESALLALPEGTLYHRPGCRLVTGKERAEPVAAAGLRERGLTPCPVCDPAPPDPVLPDAGRTD